MKKYFVILSIFFLQSCEEYTNEAVAITEIQLPKSKVYLKEVTWGLTGDSKLIYVGFSNNLKDTVEEMVFKADFVLYKFENDTLHVCARSDAFRKENFEKKHPLKIEVLDNIEMSDLLKVYKERGLQKNKHIYDK